MPQVRANDIHIEIESFGRDSDPAVLLIMGFSGQLTLWPVSFCEGLADLGYRVIRFTDREVVDRLDEIVEVIAAQAVPPPSPTLPPSRGKGEKRYEIR